MASAPFHDITGINPEELEYDLQQIREFNPHRHEFEQIDGILRFFEEPLGAIAVRHVRGDEFWCRGHMPGDPIFPGVLIVEAAAQVASFCYHMKFGKFDDRFFGFGGLENVRFRGTIRPGDDVLLLTQEDVVRKRIARFNFQAFVNQKLVADGKVIGVTVPVSDDKNAGSAS